MHIVTPQVVTPGFLLATNVVNAEPAWVPGTYNRGDRVVFSDEVYEVVADPDTSDQPDLGAVADPPTWVALGWSNQWRMFRDGTDSLSTAVGEIDVTIENQRLTSTLGALGLQGSAITVTVTDGVEGVVFEETRPLVDIGASDWWEYFFLPYDNIDAAVFDLPPYPGAEIRILLEGASESDPVAVGRVVFGISRDIGVTLYGTGIQLQDYSVKERDGFGTLILRPRRTIKRVDYDVHVPTERVSFVIRELSRLGAVPTLYIGDPQKPATIVYGVYADVSQGITTPSISDLTLQVEEF